jgi:hypothetical protein
MRSEFWSENLVEREQLEDLGVDVRILSKLILQKYGMKVWIKGICSILLGI